METEIDQRKILTVSLKVSGKLAKINFIGKWIVCPCQTCLASVCVYKDSWQIANEALERLRPLLSVIPCRECFSKHPVPLISCPGCDNPWRVASEALKALKPENYREVHSPYKAFILDQPYLLEEGNYFLRNEEDLMTAEQFPRLVPKGVEEPEDGMLIVGFSVAEETNELSEQEGD